MPPKQPAQDEDEDEGEDEEADNASKSPSSEDDVSTFEGEALPLTQSFEIANAYPTHVILMMGEREAGKTTLLAELHHSFLRAPFAEYLFAGSRTLIGFEKNCFLARHLSGEEREDTERTKYSDIRLLHLALTRPDDPRQVRHLLLTDVSGERFKEIRSSRDEAEEIAPLVRRANHTVLLVDGNRLSVPRTQASVVTKACLLLRGLVEAGGLSSRNALHVVISKWDYVLARSATDQVQRLQDAIRKAAPTLAPQFHFVAARVTESVDIDPGYGLATLLQAWMAPTSKVAPCSDYAISATRAYLQYSFDEAL